MTNVSRAVLRLFFRVATAIAVLLVLWFFGPTLWHLLSPFILAIPVAAALQKPIRWGEKKLHLKHGLSVAIWVVLVCAVIVALLYWLLSVVVGQIIQLSANYQTIINDVVGILRSVINQLFDALDYVPDAVEEWARGALNDGIASLAVTATRWVSVLFNFTVSFASSIPYALIYLNFLLLGIFFISSDYMKIKSNLMGHMGDSLRTRSQMLSGSAGHGLAGYVKVQLLYGVLVLCVSWPVLTLFGLPYPFLIALLAAILEFLPVFGNGTLYVPWAIICYIIGMPTLALEMMVLHLALFIFRRVTEPKLMSNHMGLSTLLSLVAMFVGMQIGGVLGLIFAPVVMVMLQGAWQQGIFTATMCDAKTVTAYLQAFLADPPACATETGDKKEDGPLPPSDADQKD